MRMKYMDGSPVDAAYEAAISKLVSEAARASDICTDDELEEFASEIAKRENHPQV